MGKVEAVDAADGEANRVAWSQPMADLHAGTAHHGPGVDAESRSSRSAPGVDENRGTADGYWETCCVLSGWIMSCCE